MNALTVLREFTGAEWRSIRRDSTLRWMVILVFVLALLTRWLVPWISVRFDLDLVPHYPLIMSLLVVFLAPVIVGYIVGMLLLDERDEGTLQALSVTPLPMWRYLTWKLSLPVAATTILTVLMFPMTGFMPFRSAYLTSVVVGAMWAPLLALMMSSFARNKVQGFVLMRISNVLLTIPLLAWFFPRAEPFVAFFPAYWPLKSFWLAAEGHNPMPCFMVGTAFHLALIAWLFRRFQIVLRRAG